MEPLQSTPSLVTSGIASYPAVIGSPHRAHERFIVEQVPQSFPSGELCERSPG
jgi:hypothetical protein